MIPKPMLSPGLQEEFPNMNFALVRSSVTKILTCFQKAEVLSNKSYFKRW